MVTPLIKKFEMKTENETRENFNDQRRRNNDQLGIEKEQLRKEKETLQMERDQLRIENEKLRTEKETLQMEHDKVIREKEQLREEKETLQTEHEQLREEKETLQTQHDKVKREKEQLRKEKETLQTEHDKVKREKEQLRKEKETLQTEHDKVKREKEQLRKEKETLQTEHEQLRKEKETLQTEHDKVIREKEQLTEKKETLQTQHDKVKREKEQLREERETLQTQHDKLRQEIDDRKAQFENGLQNSYLFPDWRKKYYQAANVTLDPDTAHPALILSEERRVSMGEKPQDLPRIQMRFESLPCVLGKQSFSSERHFWEVKVNSCTAWDLGICRSNVMRKERTYIKPEDGFWAIRFYNHEYWALTSPKTQLTLKKPPGKICIFLDYEDQRISFYNMTDNSHIHTFSQGAFYGSLRPFFRLWSKDSGHLDICPLPKEPEA